MRILFLCHTPYQIMVAIQLKKSQFSNYTADIIISDKMVNSDEILKKIKKTKVFEDVYKINVKNKLSYKKCNRILNIIKQNIRIKDMLMEYITLEKKYDMFLFANLDEISRYIGLFIEKVNKKHIKFYMFEDGMSTYSNSYGDYISLCKSGQYSLKHLKVLITNPILCKLEGIYVFRPEILSWKPHFNVFKIEPITLKYKKLLNYIFSYQEIDDLYSEKFIFFEESYHEDGVDINDIEVVNKISSIVGKENIIIKIHPRNSQNRFKTLGYKTNSNISIPWEVIAMNIDIKNKILLTIGSNAVIAPHIFMNLHIKGILLFDIIKNKDKLRTEIVNITKEVCLGNEDNYKIPQNYKELEYILKRI